MLSSWLGFKVVVSLIIDLETHNNFKYYTNYRVHIKEMLD